MILLAEKLPITVLLLRDFTLCFCLPCGGFYHCYILDGYYKAVLYTADYELVKDQKFEGYKDFYNEIIFCLPSNTELEILS